MSYESPGVKIEEVPSGPQPIAAVSTSVVAVLGTTRKGPVQSPTRVTGWSDYVRTFGAATARGFVAESVFGYFENGGPAAWIVRVDPSGAATWAVKDGQATPAASFTARAASPGAWANVVHLRVAPDFSGGMGTMARAVVSGTGTVAVPAGAASIPVSAPGGLTVGDTVVLANRTATSAATVTGLPAGHIDVNSASAISLQAGDVIALSVPAGATSLTFAAGSGVKAGDLLAIQRPDGSRVDAVAAGVTQSGPAMTVTLRSPLGAAEVAAGFARRRATFTGATTGNTGGTLPLSKIAWDVGDATGPRNADAQLDDARLTLSNGALATWSGGTFRIAGGTDAPTGTLSAEVQVRVATYTAPISLAPTSVGDVLSAFSFLPVGTAITLAAGATMATVNRTGPGVTDADGAVTGAFGPTFTTATFVLPANASNGVVVRCLVPPRVGEFVVFSATKTLAITAVTSIDGDVYVLDFAETTNLSTETGGDGGRFALVGVVPTTAFPGRFTLTVLDGGVAVETFPGLALDPGHPAYYARDGVVNGTSNYVSVAERAAGAAISSATMPAGVDSAQTGIDGKAATEDYRLALEKLETVDEPAMVIAPDSTLFPDPLIQADLIGKVVTHCETFRRFAVIDGPEQSTTPPRDRDKALLDWRNATVSSTYAAVYAPHVQIVTIDPDSQQRYTMVPPSGFVAGVFARTDRERGVHKAPANERVRGIIGIAELYTERRQDLLNPASVNLIRNFPGGRGTRIWAARNATDDGTWRWVNVRRLFNMIENSVDLSTQWVVFEPNTATTWIRIKVSVENFLDQQWRAGALAGTKPEEAYRVRVGLGETMTEADVDAGLVVTEVALAPAKPAEFVVFRFSHKRLTE